MISSAQLALDAAQAGEGGLFLIRRYADIPPYQWRIRFADLAERCPHRVTLGIERRPANALNVEIGQPMPRCSLRAPDGRGLAWVQSGGSWLAYGTCSAGECAGCNGEMR